MAVRTEPRLLFAVLLLAVEAVAAQPLPNTEMGNVIVRKLDQIEIPLTPTYIGHAGVFGEWKGNDNLDPADYTIYDMTETTSTIRSGLTYFHTTVSSRTFDDFTRVNALIVLSYRSHVDAYRQARTLQSPGGDPMSPTLRLAVVNQAKTWIDRDLTTKLFPFTKKPSTNTFRCDGFVEHVLEAAGVGDSQGFWRSFLEPTIVTPVRYVDDWAAKYEAGRGPSITVTTTGGGTVNGGDAISSTTVTVTATEESTGSGLKYIILVGPTSNSTRTVSGLSAVETFSSLTDGAYSIRALDKAGNENSAFAFQVDSGNPGGSEQEAAQRSALPPVVPSTFCVVLDLTDAVSGIASVNMSNGSGFSSTWTARQPYQCSTDSSYGPFCGLAASTYTVTIRDCAGNESASQFEVRAETYRLTLSSINGQAVNSGVDTTAYAIENSPLGFYACGGGAANCTACNPLSLDNRIYMRMMWSVGTNTPVCLGAGDPWPSGSTRCCNQATVEKALSTSFTITNTTDSASGAITVFAYLDPPGPERVFVSSETSGIAAFGSMSGGVEVSQAKLTYPATSTDTVATMGSFYAGTQVQTLACSLGDYLLAKLKQVLGGSGNCYEASGSLAVFESTVSLRFQYTDAAVATTTLKIHYFDGASWSTGAVSGQGVVKDTTTGVVTATGAITYTGIYAMFYSGQDSSAPVTSFSIAGSSSVFDGTLFVSTNAFFVLTATDPVVAGFASQVSTTNYRVDASSTDAFSVYSGSVSLAVGPHRIEYRSEDYAGNLEPIRTSTILVTAGTLARTGDVTAGGRFLAGYSDSGADFEIEAQSESDYILKVSSPDGRTMLSVANVGYVGLGTDAPQARLDISAGEAAALQLRSGNSTGTPTSVQIAFGYNGTDEMRHAIRTEHNASTTGNRMSFLLWTPGQSTASLGSMELLSLWASTSSSKGLVHIRPVGSSTEELIVSNGATTGGGTIHRFQAAAPSSREIKKDIVYLDERDEEGALRDVLSLDHVRFRYKVVGQNGELVPDPNAPLRRGLLYEDAPQSIRAQGGAISIDERVVNLSLALKVELRKLRELQRRIRLLQERQRP